MKLNLFHILGPTHRMLLLYICEQLEKNSAWTRPIAESECAQCLSPIIGQCAFGFLKETMNDFRKEGYIVDTCRQKGAVQKFLLSKKVIDDYRTLRASHYNFKFRKTEDFLKAVNWDKDINQQEKNTCVK